ncbi:MAG: diaminopimelate decarboxylase [Bacillota bacterium]
MHLSGTKCINTSNHLEIGGCDTVELARKFGTPLYILDEAEIRERCRAYRESFARVLPKSRVIYAGKALLTEAVCLLMNDESVCLDVVSGGELYTAMEAGFPADRIFFHGNNKSDAEIYLALQYGVGCIVVDGMADLDAVNNLSLKARKKTRIYLRVTPGIEAHTHSYIQTGMQDSKFGLNISSGAALAAARTALGMSGVDLRGYHCHIGSQIFDLNSFSAAVDVMIGFMAQVRRETGAVFSELDLGGGLGSWYYEEDAPPGIPAYAEAIAEELFIMCKKFDYPVPEILVEPGRSLVGEAGTTLYTVGNIKEIPGIRKYVAVDGGMADNPRVALYQAVYRAAVANRVISAENEKVTVTGRCCESGDMLLWDIALPRMEKGDLLAVFTTGAYNYAMSSNYNRIPRPAMILVADGKADLILERESYQDLVRLDRVPERLRMNREGRDKIAL